MNTQHLPRVILLFVVFTQLPLCNSVCADALKPTPTPSIPFHNDISVPWLFPQTDVWDFKPIRPGDPNKPIVDEEVRTLISKYKQSGIATADVAAPVQLQTGVLKRLFPKYSFYMIGWSERPVPGEKGLSLGGGLYYCLAVSANGVTSKIAETVDTDGYAKFLSNNNITIRSIDDARLVWLAFCDITIVPFHSWDLVQVSPMEWHLGINDSDEWLDYYKFKLGAGQKVVSVESIMTRIKR